MVRRQPHKRESIIVCRAADTLCKDTKEDSVVRWECNQGRWQEPWSDANSSVRWGGLRCMQTQLMVRDHPNALLARSIQATHRGTRTTLRFQGENMVKSTLLHPPHSSISSQWFFYKTNQRWGRRRWIFLGTDKRSLDVSLSSAAGNWTLLSAWMLRKSFPRYSLTYTRRAG